jgi:hypothetical protein
MKIQISIKKTTHPESGVEGEKNNELAEITLSKG